MKFQNPFKKKEENKETKDIKRLDFIPVEGDGKAEFLEPMTESEYVTWMHEQEHGWKKVYDKLLNRNGS